MMERRDPNHEDPGGGCKLMDSFGIFIQLCLAAAAFSTLIIKRQRENPQRPVRIWAFDVSKQLVGGIVIHSLNVIASYFFGVRPEDGQESNPCVWYFLNILVDTTLGVGILWAILLALHHLTKRLRLSGFQSGVYGDPPIAQQIKQWLKQLSIYIISLMLMKAIVIGLLRIFPWISDFGEWVLRWTTDNYKLQVVFVMLIFPLVMNIIQFWVVDTIVKHKVDKKQIWLNHEEEDAENLLESIVDDEDDDQRAHTVKGFAESDKGSTVPLDQSRSAREALDQRLPTSQSASNDNSYELGPSFRS